MALNDEIYVMRESISRLTQLMAGKGIQVTQAGVSAYVRADSKGVPILVNLPYIPDNASSELIDAIKGFLDHEVAHILFTDFTVMKRARTQSEANMFNIVEDARIEKCMQDRFSGSAENLDRTGRFFLEKYTEPKLAKAKAAGDEETIQGLLMVPLIRAMSGQQVFKDYMKDKMTMIDPVYQAIKDLAPKMEALKSSADAMSMATTILVRLKRGTPAAPPAPAPPPPKPKKAAAPTPPPAPTPAATEEDEESEEEGAGTGTAKPAPTPEDDDEEVAPGATADDDDEEVAPGTKAPDPEDDDQDIGDEEEGLPMSAPSMSEEEEEESDPMASPAGAGGGDEDAAPTSGGICFDAIDKEIASGFDDSVSGAISAGASDAARSSEYLVYSTDKDVIEPLKVSKLYKDEMLSQLEDKVNHMVGPLQKDLERAISARSLSQYQPGHRSGRLHSANLSRLATGDDRVFRRKMEVTSKDVAVELVVDMSGSMSGAKIRTATEAAYALASVLERIGIPCEVICFTTGDASCGDEGAIMAEEKKLGRKYSRMESLYMPILKGFNERMSTEVKKRFGWLPNAGDLRNNVDGECIEIAARRLMGRRETGKIMMVLSDGAPAAYGDAKTLNPHLKHTVAKIVRAGVNVIGIGINSTAVQQFYPKSLVLNNVADLPIVVMKELRALILK